LNQSEFPGPPRWLMTVTVRVPQGPGPADSESELEVLKYYLPLARASVSRASQVTVSVPGNLKNVPVPLSARARGSEPCAGAVVTVRRPPAAGRRLRSGSECESVNGRLSTPPGPADHSHGPRPAGARARARPRALHRKPAGPAAARPVGDSEAGTRPESEGPGHESQDHVRRVHCNLQCSLPKQLLILRVHPLLP
jgi:hypothetical protein